VGSWTFASPEYGHKNHGLLPGYFRSEYFVGQNLPFDRGAFDTTMG
jgi:hypothetical protein